MYDTALRVLKIDSEEKPTITAEDQNNFVSAVVRNVPFKKVVAFKNVQIVFRSMPWELQEHENISQYDVLITQSIESVKIAGNEIYHYNDALSLEENYAKFKTTFGDSALFPLIVHHFRVFMKTFRELLEQAKNPDFFVEDRVEEQQ